MAHTIHQVDSFTDHAFAGNPAGVCLLEQPAEASWMQNVAKEMNLSETAFLYPESDGFHLRWFTPAAEVRLCGHATLASAYILWQTGTLKKDQQARFHTLSGLLTADLRGDWIEMDFPVRVPKAVEPPPGLAEALGVEPLFVGRDVDDYLVEVEQESSVRALQPDITALGRLPVRGTIVTARSGDPAFDFVSRFFAPAVGVNEDPVTGSAHCCLTSYWAGKLGKQEMNAFQASARGGIVKVRLAGERVKICGQAVTVMTCDLVLGGRP